MISSRARALFVIGTLVFCGVLSFARPVIADTGTGSVSITTAGVAIPTETLDTLSNTAGSTTNTTLPTGWYLTETGGGARDNEQYAVDTGASGTGDIYSYGSAAATDRALGELRSGTLIPLFGAKFTNNTGVTITSLKVDYTGEQWRFGGVHATVADRLDFQYSLNATDLSTGTYLDANALDFNPLVTAGTAGALDGNLAANRTVISSTIGGLSIANGATFFIRFNDIDATGADDGLSVDNFSLIANPVNPAISISNVSMMEGNAGTTIFSFNVTLSGPAIQPVTYDIATADGTGPNAATDANNDYEPNSSSRTIPVGASADPVSFDVTVNGDTTFEPNETFFVNAINITNTTNTSAQGVGTIQNDDSPPAALIRDIQGAGHTSPLNGQVLASTGIVTALASNGFYMQDPVPDASDATSEGIFVFLNAAPAGTILLGNSVTVTGTVMEFLPGGDPTSLTITELGASNATVATNSTGNPLPAPIIVGVNGRPQPKTIIDDDSFATFDPPNDGIDYYESLEGMRVQVNNAIATGPQTFGEVPVIPGDDPAVGVRTLRGGIVLTDNATTTDFNPEIIFVDDSLTLPGFAGPNTNTGDNLGTIVGVIHYSFGAYKLFSTAPYPVLVPSTIAQESAVPQPNPNTISIATFNVENLGGNEAQAKFDGLAAAIVNNLKSPDILSLEEMQDNDGATNNSTVDASTTISRLVAAITAAGGPTYTSRSIDPVDDQDGGQPGGNIRVVFLFRTDRGVAFVDRAGGGSTTATGVVNNAGVPELQHSPGRIDPTNPAFNVSRKPLAGEFTFIGNTIFVIANHFNSKGGDQPLFGANQPPILSSEVQRAQQAQIVNNFVDSIVAIDPSANVVVLGDINDFQFSQTTNILTGRSNNDQVLTPLIENLPQSEQYTYVFQGNSQVLDQILASNGLNPGSVVYDSVHINSEFQTQLSDHDPQIAYFSLAPNADLSVTKVDTPDPVTAGGLLTYTITVNNAGPSDAASVSLDDTLPAGTTFVSLSSPGGWLCTTPAVGAGGTVTCTATTMAPGSAVFTLTVAVDGGVASGTVISNTATVSSATSDPNSGNESGTATTTVATSADLSVTKVDTPDPVDAGANITYTITATNAGPSSSASVSLNDTLPAGTTFVSLSSPGGWSCSTPAVGSGGSVSCSKPSFAVGSAVFTLTVAVDGLVASGTVITNTATVASATSDPNTGNESGSATTTVATIDITIDDVGVTEGNVGSTPATFTVSLARAAAQTITLNWTTAGNDATSGVDFTPNGGVVTFVPGDTSEPVTVQVTGDLFDEPIETYFVNLSGVAGPGTIADAQGLGTIADDDGAPLISVDNQQVVEGSGGNTTPMTFTISLSNPSVSTVTVDATTAAGTATASSDFTPVTQQISFGPGVVTQSFSVPVLDDNSVESNETFFVNLSAPTNSALGDGQGIGTILDDDDTLPAPDPIIIANCPPVIGGPCALTAGSLSGSTMAGWTFGWLIDGVPSGNGLTIHPNFTEAGSYVVVLNVVGIDGQTGTATLTIVIAEPKETCPSGNLCMHDGRFEISLKATDPRTGATGIGLPLSENDHFGYFALPQLTGNTDNPEVFVKILDGRSVTGSFWVFYGGLTDLELEITVIDTETGEIKVYSRPGGSAAGGFDVGAGVTPEECVGEVEGTKETPVAPGSCVPGTDRLCLLGGRFSIELDARDQRTENTAPGVAIPENDLFGYFSLPGLTGDATNPEVFVKVLDGTVVNGHNWLFYAGLTDLEYTVTVTDTTTGVVTSYTKDAGSACGGFDVNGL